MCCTLSNGQEVSALLAALHLMRETPFYASHKFVPLHLDLIVSALFRGEEDTVVLEQLRERAYKPFGVLMDYCCRSTTIKHICLMKFKRCWGKREDTNETQLQDSHPQSIAFWLRLQVQFSARGCLTQTASTVSIVKRMPEE